MRLKNQRFPSTILLVTASVLGCHQTGLTTATTPEPERLVAEASILKHGKMDEHVFLPITVHGHSVVTFLDLGADLNILDQDWFASLHPTTDTDELDSLTLGTATEQHIDLMLSDFKHPVPGLPPVVGLLGTRVLSHYDLEFDGPAHQVRLYAGRPLPPQATPRASQNRQAAWLPPGITPADCTPRRGVSGAYQFVGFDLQVNGHPVSGYFDSGSKSTVMNLAAAHLLGITQHTPHVRLLPADSGNRMPFGKGGRQKTYIWQGVDITMGNQHLQNQEVHIFSGVPIEQPMVGLGLDAFRDRILWVSYSTNQVCLSGVSDPHK